MHTGQQDCSFDDLRRAWRFADDHGYVWISVWDHFYEAPYVDGQSVTYETVAAFAALAADTSRKPASAAWSSLPATDLPACWPR